MVCHGTKLGLLKSAASRERAGTRFCPQANTAVLFGRKAVVDRRQFASFAFAAAPTAFGSELAVQPDPTDATELSTRDVLKAVNDENWVLVGTRPTDADDSIIISGEDPTASYRLAIVLRYMAVEDVRVLNGGVAAWKAAKYRVETRSNQLPIARSFGARIPKRPHLIDEISRVKAGLSNPNKFTLVDTRTWAEFTGETSGYKYHIHKGRIPGSVFGQADFKGPNSLAPYRNIDNTMRNAVEIHTLWKKSGIDTEKHLSFLRGSGWRAAEVLTFAQVMGLSNTSLYSDGWIGWSNDPHNPVESGRITAGTAPK